MTLTEFLLARIAEDHDRAQRAASDPLSALVAGCWADAHTANEKGEPEAPPLLWMAQRVEDRVRGLRDRTIHDPARALAECESKRRIIDIAEEHTDSADPIGHLGTMFFTDDYKAVLASLALPYADHPDYDPEWRP